MHPTALQGFCQVLELFGFLAVFALPVLADAQYTVSITAYDITTTLVLPITTQYTDVNGDTTTTTISNIDAIKSAASVANSLYSYTSSSAVSQSATSFITVTPTGSASTVTSSSRNSTRTGNTKSTSSGSDSSATLESSVSSSSGASFYQSTSFSVFNMRILLFITFAAFVFLRI